MKTFIVTGASRGIGKATAEKLLQDGHRVIGTYKANKDGAPEKRDNLTVYHLDLSDYTNIDKFVSEVGDIMLDGIVNSAGLFEEVDFAKLDVIALEKNFKVNAFAPVYLVSKLQNNLKDGSAIVNISSTDALVGSYLGIGYSASKAAISNFTLSLANILAPRRIRVNGIAPGWIGDGMRAPDELLKLAADYNPLKRLGTYMDVANLVSYLLSDDAAYVNGTVIAADGGDLAKSYILEKESELSQDSF